MEEYRSQAEAVLRASADLTDEKKLKAEFFDNKVRNGNFMGVPRARYVGWVQEVLGCWYPGCIGMHARSRSESVLERGAVRRWGKISQRHLPGGMRGCFPTPEHTSAAAVGLQCTLRPAHLHSTSHRAAQHICALSV